MADSRNLTFVSVDADIPRPTASWRVPRPSERIAFNPADSLPFRLLAWIFLVMATALLFALPRGTAMFFGDLKLFIVLASAQYVLIYLLTKSSNEVFLGTGLKRLRAKVPTESACPTSIQVIQDGSVTGTDEGFIWLEDGTLYFKGLHSVWRLNRDDVMPIDQWPARWRKRGKPLNRVILIDSEVMRQIHFRLIDPFEDFATRRRAAKFYSGLRTWLEERPEGSLESVLPPLELHPGLERNGPFRWEGVVSGLILVAINIALLIGTRPDFTFGSTVALQSVIQFVVVLSLIYFSVRFAWQQMIDRRVRSAA